MIRFAASILCLALAACGSSEPGPGGATANEASALDDAAEMVESRRIDDGALKAPAPDQGEAQATEAAPPAK